MPDSEIANYDIVTIHNIDSEPFEFAYNTSAGNPPYIIPAGEIRRFPRFIAEHGVKHLIDKILTKNDRRTNDEVARAELASQIVMNEEVFQQGRVESPAEKEAREVEALNKPSDLEAVLKKNRGKAEIVQPPAVATEASVVEEKFEGLAPGEETLKGDEVDTTAPPVPEPVKAVEAVPTRSEIYAYATKNGMTLDEKSKAVYDKMKVSELLVELGDPREDLTK